MQNYISEVIITYQPTPINTSIKVINSSRESNSIFREVMDNSLFSVKEECALLFLNKANKIVGIYHVSSGGITGTVVDIRIILGIALKALACNIILAHTHPSGNLTPSQADEELTRKLKEAAKLMDISLLDHLIITSETYFSFADEGQLGN